MVKIENRDPQKAREIQRTSKLVDIAKAHLSHSFNVEPFTIGTLFIIQKEPYKSAFMVATSPTENEINVHSPEYLDAAVTLARAYEDSGEKEFTVKKQYDET